MSTNIRTSDTFRIVSERGAGGDGIVYEAWHTRLEKCVAVKANKGRAAVNIKAQYYEYEALRSVHSPYLPKVYDCLPESDRVLMVMEYIAGDSFAVLLDNGRRFSRPSVIKWYFQIASALEDIHRQGVCHRDIKPANIMLKPGGEVCLIDFNNAIVRGSAARLISRSFGYASPEQSEIYERIKTMGIGLSTYQLTKMINDIDWKRSDIYSLGASMYHILTGIRPRERADDVAANRKFGLFISGIESIIDRSMQPEPSKRFKSAAELLSALKKLQ